MRRRRKLEAKRGGEVVGGDGGIEESRKGEGWKGVKEGGVVEEGRERSS